MDLASARSTRPERPKPWNDPRWRGLAIQAALLAVVVACFVFAAHNARVNMAARGMPTGFGFWWDNAKFDVSQKLIPFDALSSNARAFLVGLLNTLVVAVIGIVLATVLGFTLGAMRLSRSWLAARLAGVYVESIRNVPLLLQLLFWYFAVLSPLPGPKQSVSLLDIAFLNNRGLFVPEPMFLPGFGLVAAALVAGLVLALIFRRVARRRQRQTGEQWPVGLVSTGLILGLPLAVHVLLGRPLDWSLPVLKGFNFQGGLRLTPEAVALVLGLTLYTAAFIAEIVRAGILAVSHGQVEAAHALGLAPGLTRRLVVMPQAMRVIVPPLISQYLNLTKNSSLAVFIGFSDFVQVTNTVLVNTGAAMQVQAITMATYLAISLGTAGAVNLFNRRFQLQER